MHGEPFDRSLWDHILKEHGGMLPVEIRALPEGLVVPVKTPLVTVVNTDPACFWLTSFLETALLRAIWYPTTVASVSYACKSIIKEAFEKSSCEDPAALAFKLHDFGARGTSSQESAAIGGMAHLVNFRGTDTVSGILAARKFYGEPMAGFSIPAAEHSTITSWGKDREDDAYLNMLTQFGDSPMIAVVSDSYDIFNAVDNIWGDRLKRAVLQGKPTLVIRPDSGDPATMPIEVIERLGNAFGFTMNAKGYKVLHPKVRVIQGDGITHKTIGRIVFNLLEMGGWSIDNLAFGMGGGLLQHCNRDTLKFAMKCSAIKVDGGMARRLEGAGRTARQDVEARPVLRPGLQRRYRDRSVRRDDQGTGIDRRSPRAGMARRQAAGRPRLRRGAHKGGGMIEIPTALL